MKNILISFLLLSIFIGCEKPQDKKVDNVKFSEAVPGGCALGDSTHVKDGIIEPDTVYFTLQDGNLNVFVGFNAECCLKFATDSHIGNDTIFMYINYLPSSLCNCLCYYTYNFLFTGIVDPYYYVVNIDDWLIFNGQIAP